MTAARYVLTAAPERQRFASAPRILAFGAVVALALFIVFPARSLEERLGDMAPANDQVTQAYLNTWLRANPGDQNVRRMLARYEMQAGHYDKAQGILRTILAATNASGYDRAEADLMLLDVLEQKLWSTPEDSPEFASLRDDYLRQMRAVSSYGWESDRLEHFADQAIALGDMHLGHDLYLRLIQYNPYNSLNRILRLAKLDLESGNYRESASLYFRALTVVNDNDSRRKFFLQGIAVLRSGNLLPEAIAASQTYAGPYADDSGTLTYLIHLALAGHRPDVAAKFASRLIRQRVSA